MRWIEVATDGYEAALKALRRELPEADSRLSNLVSGIIAEVRRRGDDALLELGRRFDAPDLESLVVTEAEFEAVGRLGPAVRSALDASFDAVRSFHEAQRRTSWFRHDDGRVTGQILRPLGRVGIYVPGGRARYPSTVIMCGAPALAAGVPDVALCTPPARDGSVHPAVLYAARLVGARAVYKIGGAQAVAALAYGTQTVPRVDKVVGPGNVYVCEAKRQLWGVTDMDMLAGPSEVCVVADSTASPAFAAADLVTQAEHDADCAAFLLTPDPRLAARVRGELEARVARLERSAIAGEALERNGALIITRDLDEAVALANACAPEHLALMVEHPEALLATVRNAGAVMLGSMTPQTAGDYIAGPSHTLPTGGSARFWSPLNVDTFTKKTSFMSFDADALGRAAPHMIALAEAEGLGGHADAVRVRIRDAWPPEPHGGGDDA